MQNNLRPQPPGSSPEKEDAKMIDTSETEKAEEEQKAIALHSHSITLTKLLKDGVIVDEDDPILEQ